VSTNHWSWCGRPDIIRENNDNCVKQTLTSAMHKRQKEHDLGFVVFNGRRLKMFDEVGPQLVPSF
jgi:hypothetical protein